MNKSASFELQGHRGARGLRPENTLPSFELALDLGVDAIETDVHLTSDGVPILCHEPILDARLCRACRPGVPGPETKPFLARLTLDQVRGYRADVNPDPVRFPKQQAGPSPLADMLAAQWGHHPYGLPTVAELFSFVRAYAGEEGANLGKTADQRQRAARLIFDLELKRVPFHPELINDGFVGREAGLLEVRLLEEIRRAGVLDRTRVRSFDHRCLAAIKALEPRLALAVLIADTAPISPARLAREVGAEAYCPDYRFVDEELVRRAHAEGVRVIPWTVNDAADWKKLRDWGVDGITTDYPARIELPNFPELSWTRHEQSFKMG
jgi:glycerophosphoryl diester phosphodiesterase